MVFQQYRAACGIAPDAAARAVCARAQRSNLNDEAAARAFLQDNFRPVRVAGEGTLTAYFTPEYPARRAPDAEFSAPVRPKPPQTQPAAAIAPAGQIAIAVPLAGEPALVAPAGPAGPPTRAQIDAWPANDALAWMRPEDLFFMQIQGSGVLDFPGGRRLRAVTVATNGLPFVGIAAPMRQRGLLADNRTSGEAIRAWLAAHHGAEADEVMQLNTRYGFFALQPYDGRGVAGAAGVQLPSGRAIAVDRSRHALGGLYWISADAPALAGAAVTYNRAVMALDVGGAIRGAVRADLYVGLGEAAGREAGRVRHRLRLYELEPRQ